MRKLIDLPDNIIGTLKKIAKKDHRTPKGWIEHLIIETLLTRIQKTKGTIPKDCNPG